MGCLLHLVWLLQIYVSHVSQIMPGEESAFDYLWPCHNKGMLSYANYILQLCLDPKITVFMLLTPQWNYGCLFYNVDEAVGIFRCTRV